jgi:hypothetical protein
MFVDGLSTSYLDPPIEKGLEFSAYFRERSCVAVNVGLSSVDQQALKRGSSLGEQPHFLRTQLAYFEMPGLIHGWRWRPHVGDAFRRAQLPHHHVRKVPHQLWAGFTPDRLECELHFHHAQNWNRRAAIGKTRLNSFRGWISDLATSCKLSGGD